MTIVALLATAIVGFVIGLLVGKKNPSVADEAVRLSEKIK